MEASPSAAVRSVSIIAMGPSLFSYLQDYESQYKRPTQDVWAINSAGVWLHDIDRIIALDNFGRDWSEHEQYVRNITSRGVPVVSDVVDERWPSVSEYPLRRVLDNIWPDATDNSDIIPPLTNTCAYALALAIADEYQEIRLYGYEFRRGDRPNELYATADAYSDKPFWWPYHMKKIVEHRRDMEPGEPCCMFLLGVAHARGIHIHIAPGSTFADQDRAFYYYGYEVQPQPFRDASNAER